MLKKDDLQIEANDHVSYKNFYTDIGHTYW